MMAAYRFYLGRVMPAVVRLSSEREANAYRYLAQTVSGFPQPAVLARELEAIGFEVAVQRMTIGIVAFHVGVRRD
jgi:ubiquinone/menaquinone biosynthesis C-methylase UbiE